MAKIKWQDNPPTYREWLNAQNEGYWWLKMHIGPMIYNGNHYPGFDLYEIVRIFKQVSDNEGKRTDRLGFDHHGETIFLDDLPDGFVKLHKWKAVDPYGD